MRTAAVVMTKNVVRINGDATVAKAILSMRYKDVSSLVVNPRTGEDEYGIVIRLDIMKKVVAEKRDPSDLLVRDIMSKPAICVSPDSPLCDCAILMARAKTTRVLVLDAEELVGMVSSTDVFNTPCW